MTRRKRNSSLRLVAIMAMVSSVVVLVCCNALFHKSDPSAKQSGKPSKRDSFDYVNILFAGDVMAHLPQIEAARTDSDGHFDFSPEFENVSSVIKQADISVVNLETTFGGTPYSGYPQFSAPDTLAWFVKAAGFNLVADANNHAADRGKKGILGTIEGLDRAGLAHMGTYVDSSVRARTSPHIIDKNGIRIAFLNYTYGTNGIKVHPPEIVNYIDTNLIKRDIAAAHALQADAIVAFMHWGIEYQRLPNAEQKKIAMFCLQNGVDVIIGSHPHVVQPAYWETYRRKGDTTDRKGLVLYSLGNFVSNQRQKYTDGGIIFGFQIKKNRYTQQITVQKPTFLPTWVYIQPKPRSFIILPSNKFAADTTLVNQPAQKAKMISAFEDNREEMKAGTAAAVEMR